MSELSKVDVVGVGLNATDTIIIVPELPARGAKVESSSVRVLPGGQVATAMIACQHWGLRTRYVGKLGDDSAAEVHRQEFNRGGVETHLISIPACSSQQSFILVDPEGEHCSWLARRASRFAT
jgi:sulfofructose kinase